MRIQDIYFGKQGGRRLARVPLMLILVVGMMAAVLVSPGAGAQESLMVRSADHPHFSRIVFDWTERVSYTPVLSDGVLRITFDRGAVPDFGRLDRRALKFFGNPRYVGEGGRLVVMLDVFGPVRVHHFQDGTKVAVDVIEPAPDRSPQQDQPQSQPQTPPPSPAATISDVTQMPARKVERVDRESLAPSPDGLKAGTGDMSVRVESRGEGLTLTYPWTKPVPAAIFTRHNLLWVVFNQKAVFDHTALAPHLGPVIKAGRQIEHAEATILQYRLAPGYFAKADRSGSNWDVTLQPGYAVARQPIRNGQQSGSGHGENFFFALDDPGAVLRVRDPVIGDELAIVPAPDASQGVIARREFTEFKVLETAQGIALELVADRLLVERYRNGIGVSSGIGLALSKSRLSENFELKADTAAESPAEKARLIDLEKWREGPLPAAGFTLNRQEILYHLSRVSDDARNRARWDMARFYIANGYAPDAHGILQLMRERDPELMDTPEFRAVLGVTLIRLRRHEEAARLLTHKTLVTELDAYLWRAVANEALGRNRAALEDYRKGADILSLQDPRDRVQFVLAAIRAAYRLDEREFMNAQMAIVRRYPLTAAQETELDYWQARLAEESGYVDKARAAYEAVIQGGVRKTAAWARLALTNSALKSGVITPAEAIDRLEKLRFSWRGDDFELDLLVRLGGLYVTQHQYRTGLETLKQAATYFKRSAKTRNVTGLMSDIYRDLFLNGEADRLAPVKAVALYNDFRELTPLGPDGDNMARRLADRLVAVDLLAQAAEILEHQIRHRLKGVAQADVASRLAMIYILDAKPDRALNILRATRQAQNPDDVERKRRLIEARALIQLDRFEEAEVLLQEDEGPDIDRLRADIYWSSENWPMVVQHSRQQLGRRWQEPGELSPAERQTVLRLAVALSLAEDKDGLAQLRTRYMPLMQQGRYAEAFEVITAQQKHSGADVRRLTQSIASVDRLETFMDSYREEFSARAPLDKSGS